jgi:peptidoglycan/LPS O-acetylase OafA/YrhL
MDQANLNPLFIDRHLQVDFLRGLAALAVTYFHLTGSSGLTDQTLVRSGSLGWLGVEVFFCISGFVIPYSLWKVNYSLHNFGSFFLRRIIRVDPPFLASILLGICVGFAGMGVAYELPTVTRALMHVGYLNVFTGDWLSPVYWTLAIELQFYLLLGLAYPLFVHRRSIVTISGILIILMISIIVSDKAFIPHWIGIFGMGILVFRFKVHLASISVTLLGLVLLTAASSPVSGSFEAIAGLIASVFIAFVRISQPTTWFKPFEFLGVISYSLYLIHWDLGRAALSVARHLPIIGSSEIFRVAFGLFFAIGAAFIFYRLIEKPSMLASRLIPYSRSKLSL